ncbi:NAD(P)-dependent oxidoreductase [Salinibacterium sp. G-O1]|uniref:NAD(P)-dependent oxidoreductase n=1 Tax=Salinibacterium sp. G-O1 TaxID=3046208 RepID=UPI0024B89054|nr:NAD(P)-dependent oxidoreductase [Salinibacterium sp. G-O1]MDJ0334051.1 NAD(P)-dependent oxidoreductase [Salinibacterium sp. G-O1]
MTGRVLITPRSLTAAGHLNTAELRPLTEAGYELVAGPAGVAPVLSDLERLPRDIVGWLAGVERIGAAELDLFPDLRVISRNGAGSDTVNLDAAAARGVEVLTARGANARGVAELALAHLLGGIRGIASSHEALRNGRWSRTLGREFPDLTIGVVGYGAIGRLVAEFCLALGAQVLVSDPFATVGDGPARQVSLAELFASSDAITLHSPPAPDGSALVDAALLATMPSGSTLVNTARWGLVDPGAALAALNSGQLGAYAVDAFAEEPPVAHPLLSHPNVTLTAHLGAYTDASTRRAVEFAVANLLVTLASGSTTAH